MPRGVQLMDDTIGEFIEMVRENKFIYDSADKHHMDAYKANEFWELVGEELGVKDMDGKAWRSRWRNMRDTFVKQRKALRNMSCSAAAKQRIKWKFYDQMAFLEPFLACKRREASVSQDVALEEESVEEVVFKQEVIPSPVSSIDESQETQSTERSWSGTPTIEFQPAPQRRTIKRPAGRSSVEETMVNYTKQNRTSYEESGFMNQDADILLFQSYALRMKSLPMETQAVIKLQISQIFYNAENPHASPVQLLPLS